MRRQPGNAIDPELLMIVNHQKRFVFIHVPKVAGTSIRSALLGVHGCARPEWATTKHLTDSDIISRHCAHGIDISKYFFFAFVRNPWDRFASLHRYLHKVGRPYQPALPSDLNDFARMLEDRVPWVEGLHSVRPQCDFLRAVDVHVGRYERLSHDFGAVCSRLGLSITLKRKNRTVTKAVDFRPLYSDRSAKVIEDRYAEDIQLFDYSFDPDG